jgi:hypothetical protein
MNPSSPDVTAVTLDALRQPLRKIGVDYLAARRRSGTALLESAGRLAEARAEAQNGEWLAFLKVTGTGPDTAERLLHVHALAQEMPHFAAWVERTNEQSLAYELARPSTPRSVVEQVIAMDVPPTVAELSALKRRAQAGEELEIEEPPVKAGKAQALADMPEDLDAHARLRRAANDLTIVAGGVTDLSEDSALLEELARVETALEAIRQALGVMV